MLATGVAVVGSGIILPGTINSAEQPQIVRQWKNLGVLIASATTLLLLNYRSTASNPVRTTLGQKQHSGVQIGDQREVFTNHAFVIH